MARAVASMAACVVKEMLWGNCTIGLPGKRFSISIRMAWWRGQISPKLPPPCSRMTEESRMNRSQAGV
jgi:hypothetical protein